jgi:hypothetical protein
MTLLISALGLSLALVPRQAFARGDDDGEAVDMAPDDLDDTFDDSGSYGAPAGAEENPDAPKTLFDKPKVENKAAPEPETYPQEVVLRPVTLLGGMGQAAVDFPIGGNPVGATGLLDVDYAVTHDIQVGIRYGLGAVGDAGFTAGKAASIDAVYRLHKYAGVQLSVPMYFSPYAMGVTVGIPAKLVLFDKLSLSAGEDLVTFRGYRFAPNVADARENEGLADAYATNTILPRGEINILATLLYQRSPKLAFGGEFGIRAVDFSTSDAPVPLFFRLSYSPSDKLDIGGRVGFGRLDSAADSFGGSLFAAFRM